MGIISLEHSDRLLWLGRYVERVYTTTRLFADSYDVMIDADIDDYITFCKNLDIPNVYSSSVDFVKKYCFSKEDGNSIYANLTRAYDNAIVLREEISSEALSYIQLAMYNMEQATQSKAPLIDLQKVIDNLMAFWGTVDDKTENENARNIIKTGKHIERLSLQTRLRYKKKAIVHEINRLMGRIKKTKLFYSKKSLEDILKIANGEDVDYYMLMGMIESLI